MCELPVEYPTETVFVHEEVPHPEVTVDGDRFCGGGFVEGQPPHSELEHRSRLIQCIEESERMAQWIGPR